MTKEELNFKLYQLEQIMLGNSTLFDMCLTLLESYEHKQGYIKRHYYEDGEYDIDDNSPHELKALEEIIKKFIDDIDIANDTIQNIQNFFENE